MDHQTSQLMSDWEMLTTLADLAAANGALIKGQYPGIEYWLRLAEREAYKAMQGQSTPMSELPSIITGCPRGAGLPTDRLAFIESKLAELRAVAADKKLGSLAFAIEIARVEASKRAAKRRRSGDEHSHLG